MADNKGRLAAGIHDEEYDEEEEDFLFKLQMQIANAFYGYWKHGIGLACIVLAVTFFYGTYQNNSLEKQKETQSEIDAISRKMPEPSQLYFVGMGGMDDLTDPNRVAELEEGARRFEVVAKNGTGTGAGMAWIEAAKAWDRAGNRDSARSAYAEAHGIGMEGITGWTAAFGLAQAHDDAGDLDAAAAILRLQADSEEGFVAEYALFALANMYADGDRVADARTAYQEFATRHPDSSYAQMVTASLARLGDAS